MSKITINTDGGSRGNPGPAAIGIVFFDDQGKEIFSCGKYIGEGTNNEAEYRAIIAALEVLVKSDWFNKNNGSGHQVVCRLDSQLVVEQINGNYKIKQEHIKSFIAKINELKNLVNLDLSFVHIPREENKIADQLVNEALDKELIK